MLFPWLDFLHIFLFILFFYRILHSVYFVLWYSFKQWRTLFPHVLTFAEVYSRKKIYVFISRYQFLFMLLTLDLFLFQFYEMNFAWNPKAVEWQLAKISSWNALLQEVPQSPTFFGEKTDKLWNWEGD